MSDYHTPPDFPQIHTPLNNEGADAGQPRSCDHDWQEPRVRTLSNGTRAVYWQCLTCGSGVRAARKDEYDARAQAEVNIPFDLELRDAWDRNQRSSWEAWREGRAEDSLQKRIAWWARYDAYLLTAEWLNRRRERLEADRFQCQARLRGCTERATEAHHLTYAHVFTEPLFDLISVCRACHDAITAMDRERRSGVV